MQMRSRQKAQLTCSKNTSPGFLLAASQTMTGASQAISFGLDLLESSDRILFHNFCWQVNAKVFLGMQFSFLHHSIACFFDGKSAKRGILRSISLPSFCNKLRRKGFWPVNAQMELFQGWHEFESPLVSTRRQPSNNSKMIICLVVLPWSHHSMKEDSRSSHQINALHGFIITIITHQVNRLSRLARSLSTSSLSGGSLGCSRENPCREPR